MPKQKYRPDPNSERDLYPIPDVAHRLGISEANVWQLVADGRIASVKLGRRRLVPRLALESFVASLPAAS